MPLGRKVDGGSNYKCSDFEDRERILERITMNITFEPCVKVQNENRKIFMISLGVAQPVVDPDMDPDIWTCYSGHTGTC
jgi:hypothetical protein